MTLAELRELQIGDLCSINREDNRGKKGTVVDVYSCFVLLRAIDRDNWFVTNRTKIDSPQDTIKIHRKYVDRC